MVATVPAFQPGGPDSMPGVIRNFKFNPGTECVIFDCVLSSVVSGGGSDIVLTIHAGRPAIVFLSSFLVHSLWTTGIWVLSLGEGVEVQTLGRVNKRERNNEYLIILSSCPTQGRVEGWDSMKPLYWRSVNNKGAACHTLTGADEMKWNETNEISVEKWRNEISDSENGRKPEKIYPDRFVHLGTHMERPRRELGAPAQRWETGTWPLEPGDLPKEYLTRKIQK